MGPVAGGATAGLLYNNAFRASAQPKSTDKPDYSYEEVAKRDLKEVA